MAKRYKDESRRNYKVNEKINIKKIVICLIIIAVALGLLFIIKHNNKIEVGNAKINTYKIANLNSDLLIPKDLNEEIKKELNIENIKLVKMNYKLKDLENGKVELFYKINDSEILNLIINLKDKKLEKAEELRDNEMLEKKEVIENINEDIKTDFEENKKRLKPDEGKNILNIIITDTEIIINASQE